MAGRVRLTVRQIRQRIRWLVANEVRQRIAPDSAEYLEGESPEVQAAWTQVVWDIADKIFLETRDEPAGRAILSEGKASDATT